MADQAKGLFITGTDTGCGKTRVTLSMMAALAGAGRRVNGMKPVASGCEWRGGRLINDDAARIGNACVSGPAYDLINPWALQDPVSPHLAAARQGLEVVPEPVLRAYQELEKTSQTIIVEGVGGWRVPLSPTLQQRHLVALLDLPVILVVGLRLGCISHACLTVEAILRDGATLLGWVANHLDPGYDGVASTLEYLENAIEAPLLGQTQYQNGGASSKETDRLDLELLMQISNK